MDVELVLDARATIGESVTWVAAEHALYWIDIKAPALYRTDIRTWTTETWAVTSDIGAFALDGAGRALVALRTGLYWLDLATGELALQTPAPFDPAIMRFNEGACDSAGRFWVGIMADPLSGEPSEQSGCLHSFTSQDGLVPQPDHCTLFNGMAWNRDESTFFLSHSYENRIFKFDYNSNTGALGSRTDFAELSGVSGIPDGAAIDVDGGYWCAIHGGGRLHRYTADGHLEQVVAMPVSQPTMCCFGGDGLADLYVTSARGELSARQLLNEPKAGGIFRLRPEVSGLPKRWQVR